MKKRSKTINIIILLVLLIVNSYLTKKGEFFAKKNVTTQKPLFDIGHFYLPDTSKYRVINDVIPLILGGIATCSQHSTLFVNSVLLAVTFRQIAIYSTILPKSTTKKYDYNSLIGGCHDKIFSGHMTINILSSIVIAKNRPELTKILIFLNVIAGVLIISSRDHYTIDVIIAILLSMLIGSKCINNNECYL